jgi:hypothetical protein
MATGIKFEFVSLPDAQASDNLEYKGRVNLFPFFQQLFHGSVRTLYGQLVLKIRLRIGNAFIVLGLGHSTSTCYCDVVMTNTLDGKILVALIPLTKM